jgi:hypothetical protein
LHLVVLLPTEEAIAPREADRTVLGYEHWTVGRLGDRAPGAVAGYIGGHPREDDLTGFSPGTREVARTARRDPGAKRSPHVPPTARPSQPSRPGA